MGRRPQVRHVHCVGVMDVPSVVNVLMVSDITMKVYKQDLLGLGKKLDYSIGRETVYCFSAAKAMSA